MGPEPGPASPPPGPGNRSPACARLRMWRLAASGAIQTDRSPNRTDISEARQALDYAPATPIDIGVGRFVDWYRAFYKVP